MKRLRNTSWYAAALVAVSMSSCSKQLDEYNPGGATADAVWSTPQGFVTAVNAAYHAQRYWYGKEDGMFMAETGTDIWMNSGNQPKWQWQISQYNGIAGNVTYNVSTWKNMWIGINQCNAGINRIDKAGFTDLAEKNKRLAELRFLRGFYYWHVVEQWGNVMLRTTETDGFESTAYRSTFKELYELIISDLEFAKDNLPNDWGNAEYSRASKKSAQAMLARAYLTRAYYPDADANACFTKARDIAKDVIANATTYNVSLYPNPAALWSASNNKRNKEALYIISNSATQTAYNYDKDGNKTHQLFIANYSSHPGLKVTKDYGRDGGRLLMPTKFLLELFKAGDKRYDAIFQEQWLNNADTTFQWYDPAKKNFSAFAALNKKDISVYDNKLTIPFKALALWISRTPIPNKSTVNYCAFDMEDMYKADGTVNDLDKAGNFPSLKKFMDPNRTVDVSSQFGSNDIFVIRLAEMYAIAGEAEYKLGNAALAADQFNFIRRRAGAPEVTGTEITTEWILDERAREFCGEWMRFFDLKRMLRGEEWATYIKTRNPNMNLIVPNYWVRPISTGDLNALTNATEFGQNPGYPN